MAGIEVDSLTTYDGSAVTVIHGDTNEVELRCVRADGQRAGTGERVLGISRIASTVNGDALVVDRTGIVPAYAGAAIALSNGSKLVSSDATGRLVAHAGAAAVAGEIYTAAAAAGDVVMVDLDRRA